jgi:hypothetical protein
MGRPGAPRTFCPLPATTTTMNTLQLQVTYSFCVTGLHLDPGWTLYNLSRDLYLNTPYLPARHTEGVGDLQLECIHGGRGSRKRAERPRSARTAHALS